MKPELFLNCRFTCCNNARDILIDCIENNISRIDICRDVVKSQRLKGQLELCHGHFIVTANINAAQQSDIFHGYKYIKWKRRSGDRLRGRFGQSEAYVNNKKSPV